MKKAIYEKYEFDNMTEFFEYIVETKINGQPQQVKSLINEMTVKEIRLFIDWIRQEENTGQDARFCMESALYILGQKNG